MSSAKASEKAKASSDRPRAKNGRYSWGYSPMSRS